jgi:hypothetical protein
MKLRLKEEHIREACLVAGLLILVRGVWLIYPPAAWIVGGLILIWLSIPPRSRGER